MSYIALDDVEVIRVTHEIATWFIAFDEPASPSAQETATPGDFVLLDAPPPDVTVVSSPQEFLLLDLPADPPTVVEAESGADILVIQSGGPKGDKGEAGDQGPAGTNGSGTSYELTQVFAAPSTLWTVVHNFNTSHLGVNTFDVNGDPIEGNVAFPDDNSIEIEWFYPTAGAVEVFR